MSRTFRNWLRTLGAPEDPVATDVSSEWSALSLLKAIYKAIADGSLATGVASASDGVIKVAVSGAVAQVNLAAKRAMRISASAAASAFQAESFATFVRGAVAICAQYVRLARASRIAAATSATNANNSAIATAADAVTTAAQASIAVDALGRTAGYTMLGQRTLKDRRAAALSAGAAAASAASVPTVEQSVLGIQVYS